jgi:membrane-associated phospholipid phosphatase
VAMPVLVALSRMYRGEHHPTDILGSLIFAALWLTATSLLISPNAARLARQRRAPAVDRNAVRACEDSRVGPAENVGGPGG